MGLFQAVQADLQVETLIIKILKFCKIFFQKKAIGQDDCMGGRVLLQNMGQHFGKIRIDKGFAAGEVKEAATEMVCLLYGIIQQFSLQCRLPGGRGGKQTVTTG